MNYLSETDPCADRNWAVWCAIAGKRDVISVVSGCLAAGMDVLQRAASQLIAQPSAATWQVTHLVANVNISPVTLEQLWLAYGRETAPINAEQLDCELHLEFMAQRRTPRWVRDEITDAHLGVSHKRPGCLMGHVETRSCHFSELELAWLAGTEAQSMMQRNEDLHSYVGGGLWHDPYLPAVIERPELSNVTAICDALGGLDDDSFAGALGLLGCFHGQLSDLVEVARRLAP